MSLVDSILNCNHEYNGNSEARLATYSEEQKYKNLIKSSFPHVVINRVEKLHNKYLLAAFMLKKRENPNYKVIELIHSTAAGNVRSIEKDNLDWRRVQRAKYGYGVSFSKDADYANFHSSWSGGSSKAYIICDVLVSSIQTTDSCSEVPRAGYDTVLSTNGHVYVKFDDFTFYPKFALYYEKPSDIISKFCRHRRR